MTTFEQERTETQKLYDEAVLARVKRGLKWLEETHGPGWEDKIDLKKLDLRHASVCVLGQVYAVEGDQRTGDYENGYGYADVMVLRPQAPAAPDGYDEYSVPFWAEDWASDQLIEMGFNSPDVNWDALQAAWVDELTPRVSGGE